MSNIQTKRESNLLLKERGENLTQIESSILENEYSLEVSNKCNDQASDELRRYLKF